MLKLFIADLSLYRVAVMLKLVRETNVVSHVKSDLVTDEEKD
jgi:hypothetical protein